MRRRALFTTAFIRERIAEDPISGCWQWQGSTNGAGRATYNHQYAYRISYEVFVGPIPDGLQINHHCDNPRCVNPDHVYAGTQAQNNEDAKTRGRLVVPEPKRGEEQHLAYPDVVVDEVRRRYQLGELQKDLAAEFGVSVRRLGAWVSGGARGRTPIRRTPAPCGTRAGYCAHRARKEPTCDLCKAANTTYLRAYKARRRIGAAA